jgi:hypothetical protein
LHFCPSSAPVRATPSGEGITEFGNSLIAFKISAQLERNRASISEDQTGAGSGIARASERGVSKICYVSWTFRAGSLYFQSSALPTELPGLGVRKRVLNSRARPESSPTGRFAEFLSFDPKISLKSHIDDLLRFTSANQGPGTIFTCISG